MGKGNLTITPLKQIDALYSCNETETGSALLLTCEDKLTLTNWNTTTFWR